MRAVSCIGRPRAGSSTLPQAPSPSPAHHLSCRAPCCVSGLQAVPASLMTPALLLNGRRFGPPPSNAIQRRFGLVDCHLIVTGNGGEPDEPATRPANRD